LDDFGSGVPVESRCDLESMFDRGVIPWPASEPELNGVHASGPGRKDLNRSDEAFIAAKGAAAQWPVCKVTARCPERIAAARAYSLHRSAPQRLPRKPR
jgi:hypothetical protein